MLFELEKYRPGKISKIYKNCAYPILHKPVCFLRGIFLSF